MAVYIHKKTKGSIAELAVAARLMEEGFIVLFPVGENSRYDLVAEKNGRFVKVQVKYVTPVNGAIEISCKSSNNWSVDKYTSKDIDYLAAYNPGDKRIYFVPSGRMNSSSIKLRLTPARNSQAMNIKKAEDYIRIR